MIHHYVLTLSGTVQRLSDVLPTRDLEPYQQLISLQPRGTNGNPVYIGGPGVSSTAYGVRLEAGESGVPPAPFLISDMLKPAGAKLSDFYVIGTNAEHLHVLCLPYGG